MRVIILLFFLITSLNVNAQNLAFDGNRDYRASLNFGFTGENRGIAISFDRGFNDFISATSRFDFVVADKADFFNATNLSFGLRFHFIELLNYGEPNDLYAGIHIGHSTSGINVGYLRQITKKLGIQIETHYGFVDAIIESIDYKGVNHFKNKPRIYIGLVLNHQEPFWTYW